MSIDIDKAMKVGQWMLDHLGFVLGLAVASAGWSGFILLKFTRNKWASTEKTDAQIADIKGKWEDSIKGEALAQKLGAQNVLALARAMRERRKRRSKPE